MTHVTPLHSEHSALLVVLSYVVSVLGAYCALQWAVLIPHRTGWPRAARLGAAALAMGGGAIWSMHFIAMNACRLPFAVAYDGTLTLASLAVAVGVTGFGLYLVAIDPSRRSRLAAGGLITGVGIAAMHYTGMAAMRVPADLVFDPALVVASVVIAIAAATAALRIALSGVAGMRRFLSAIVMGAAVCGMHYTAMAAVTFVPSGEVMTALEARLNPGEIGLWVFVATLFVLGLLAMAGYVDARERLATRRTSDLAGINENLTREIEERRRAEAALRELEERSRGILESALDAVITMDEHGLVTGWNAEAARMFGWRRDEAMGEPLSTLVIPTALREAHEQGLRHYLATGVGPVLRRRIELTAQHRDGHEFPVELAISPLQLSARPAFCGFVRDITARKTSEAALRERTMYLNTLIEHSPIAILLLDPNHRIQLANPAFERLFLYERSELLGADLDSCIAPPGGGAAEAAALTRRVLQGESLHVTTARKRKDGQLVDVEVYAVPLTENGRVTGIYALYNDITSQRQLEEQLRQSQKIEAVGTLAGGIAHDFNNLLTTILGYSNLLLDEVGASSPLRSDLEEIRKAGRRAESLTRQLLAFSRKQIAVLKVFDVKEVVLQMDNMLRRLVGDDIEVVTVLDAPIGRIRADRGQIEQVLMNLVVNARDAMPQGGMLTIEVRDVAVPETGGDKRLGIPLGRYVRLAVSDTGIGMDASTRSRIFEPFFSTKEQGLGTGLGLSTVYGIVKQSGGHVTVESEPGQGARFEIWLPSVTEPVSPVDIPENPEPARPGGGETILVVEDDASVRRLACTVLRRQGYQILQAPNGEEALRVAAETTGRIALVLTDGVMPGMAVGQLIAQFRDARPDTHILIMSGHTNEAIVRRGILESDIPFIQKPFTSQMLLNKVREVMDRRTEH